MDGNQLEKQIARQLEQTLLRIPGLTLSRNARREARRPRLDLLYDIRHGGAVHYLGVDVKATGQPGRIREAVRRIKEMVGSDTKIYPVVGVPYLSDRSIEICRAEGVGCIDTAGNCTLGFGGIHLEVRGNPNPSPERREPVSLFSPKSSRVARLLLSDAGRWWGVREIAGETGVNPGLVSRLKRRLLEEDLAIEREGTIRGEPEPLLTAWLAAYSFRRNRRVEYHTLDDPVAAERRLADYCTANDIRCALALFSGAARVAPHVRMSKLFAYVDADPDEVAGALGMKRVDSGANVMLLRPYDPGVFMGATEIDGVTVLSDIQLTLDLMGYRGRGAEAAEFLLEQTIRPRWQHEANTNR